MDTRTINYLTDRLCSMITGQVLADASTWQLIPYAALQADGRTGWSSHLSLIYRYGVVPSGQQMGTDDWPPKLFIECATGRILKFSKGTFQEPSVDLVVREYLRHPERFDAVKTLAALQAQAERTTVGMSEPQCTAEREERRKLYHVDLRHTTPAKPIHWVHVD